MGLLVIFTIFLLCLSIVQAIKIEAYRQEIKYTKEILHRKDGVNEFTLIGLASQRMIELENCVDMVVEKKDTHV